MSAATIEEFEEFEVEDLDAAGVLEAAAQAELAERRAALMTLRLAYQWAVLHPAATETGVATHGGPALGVLMRNESLGGDGAGRRSHRRGRPRRPTRTRGPGNVVLGRHAGHPTGQGRRHTSAARLGQCHPEAVPECSGVVHADTIPWMGTEIH